jgi:hypothetical protein
MFFGWFSVVIRESSTAPTTCRSTAAPAWDDVFIFSEPCSSPLFGALFYARVLAVPWLGGRA